MSFSWLRRESASPPIVPAQRGSNPGHGARAKIAFSRGERSWTEEIDAVDSTARILTRSGHSVIVREDLLQDRESGLVIRPQIVSVRLLNDGSVQTVTTVETSHPDLAPRGLFEYQHATGANLEDSIGKGFEQWARLDLVPLLDALKPRPDSCTTLEFSFPAKVGKAARFRRAVLGPVAHFNARPKPRRNDDEIGSSAAGTTDDDHPFCPCCLLTHSFGAFKVLIEGDAFLGIRLFATRNAQGTPQADCRVNGEDWEAGARALREYVGTWPDAGFEIRKQYVVLQNVLDPQCDDEPGMK